MALRYSKAASKKVAKTMHERKAGTLKSGRSHRTVKSSEAGNSDRTFAGAKSRREGA